MLLASVVTGCAGPIRGLYPPTDASAAHVIYITHNHWHGGFVLKTDELPAAYRKRFELFQKYPYIEIGWGNDLFYRAKKATVFNALAAMFISPRGVLHVVGIAPDPKSYYAQYIAELYRIRISDAGFQGLMKYIGDTFETDGSGRPREVQDGLYGFSRFYRAHGYYCVLHTCNHWVADGLRETGFPITPVYSFSSNNLGFQIREYGKAYQSDLIVLRR